MEVYKLALLFLYSFTLFGRLLFNNFVSLLGYYAAAKVIDIERVGRMRLQMFSFLMCSILFLITSLIFESAQSGVIMVLFFASSFFGNFGANVTTYVMAAETYPTELRSTCHGISAFAGKAGALLATIAFGLLDTSTIFAVTAATCLMGFLFTWVFSCDLTHVSLAEHDAQLELFLEGRPEKYQGLLNKKEHLTNFEIWTGRHGEFDELWAKKLVAEERRVKLENYTTPKSSSPRFKDDVEASCGASSSMLEDDRPVMMDESTTHA
jgi:MFS family permease